MPFLRTALGRKLEEASGSLPPSESDDSIPYDPSRIPLKPSIPIQAKTLAEAIIAAEACFQVRIVPHDPPKWFRVYSPETPEEVYFLVDIHINRGDDHICPKQDLSFPLLESDTVYIGALAC